jgi:hypothetical protein
VSNFGAASPDFRELERQQDREPVYKTWTVGGVTDRKNASMARKAGEC